MNKKNHLLYDSLTNNKIPSQKDEDKFVNTFDDETLDYMFDMEEELEDSYETELD